MQGAYAVAMHILCKIPCVFFVLRPRNSRATATDAQLYVSLARHAAHQARERIP